MRLAAEEIDRGGVVLVLSQCRAHCVKLAGLLHAEGYEAVVLTANAACAARTNVLDRLRFGALRCVVATQRANVGLDVPGLTMVVLSMPGRAKGRAMQRLVHLLRPVGGKPTIVLVDLVDSRIDVLVSQARLRQAAYRAAVKGVSTWSSPLPRPLAMKESEKK